MRFEPKRADFLKAVFEQPAAPACQNQGRGIWATLPEQRIGLQQTRHVLAGLESADKQHIASREAQPLQDSVVAAAVHRGRSILRLQSKVDDADLVGVDA